jgi:hypothetical protein
MSHTVHLKPTATPGTHLVAVDNVVLPDLRVIVSGRTVRGTSCGTTVVVGTDPLDVARRLALA